MNTLKGVFNTQKPVQRKNFIRENVRQLREMQICWQNREQQQMGTTNNLKSAVPRAPHVTRYNPKLKDQPHYTNSTSKGRATRSAPLKHVSEVSNVHLQKPTKSASPECRKEQASIGFSRNKSECKLVDKRGNEEFSHHNALSKQGMMPASSTSENRTTLSNYVSSGYHGFPSDECTSRGCQTLDPSNMDNLYNEGVIKYPSSRKSPERIKTSLKPVPTRDMGLQTEEFEDTWCKNIAQRRKYSSSNNSAMGDMILKEENKFITMKALADNGIKECTSDFEDENCEPDSVRSRGRSVTHRHSRENASVKSDALKVPPNYQKGVVPKYLRERQQEWRKAAEELVQNEEDVLCPPGHVLLPDPDRKDTLKMLKKSYADLVQELNMMPVRSDTLKIRQRKIQLEKQLNKLEEGIKVFSRPKVYVKVGA